MLYFGEFSWVLGISVDDKDIVLGISLIISVWEVELCFTASFNYTWQLEAKWTLKLNVASLHQTSTPFSLFSFNISSSSCFKIEIVVSSWRLIEKKLAEISTNFPVEIWCLVLDSYNSDKNTAYFTMQIVLELLYIVLWYTILVKGGWL